MLDEGIVIGGGDPVFIGNDLKVIIKAFPFVKNKEIDELVNWVPKRLASLGIIREVIFADAGEPFCNEAYGRISEHIDDLVYILEVLERSVK